MKHNTTLLIIGLALLLAACAGTPTDEDYPIPGLNSRPTATWIPGILIVTVNVPGDVRGDWSGWTISEQFAPEFLVTNCTLYRLPDTSPQQWVGMCRMSIQEVFALPWTESDIMAVVENLDGYIEVYQSQVVTKK
jgi:hypothetical protein